MCEKVLRESELRQAETWRSVIQCIAKIDKIWVTLSGGDSVLTKILLILDIFRLTFTKCITTLETKKIPPCNLHILYNNYFFKKYENWNSAFQEKAFWILVFISIWKKICKRKNIIFLNLLQDRFHTKWKWGKFVANWKK